MSDALEVRYKAPKTLGRFMRSNAFVRCCVGPLGSGKSSACVMEIPRRAAKQKPGKDGVRRTRFAVIRNTYRQLEDTTRKTFEQWIPPNAGEWVEKDFAFEMRSGDVECEVLFRALDRPQDVKKVLSLELTGAYINELRELPKEVFDGLQGRVGRYPPQKDGGASWFGVWGDTNPWSTAHWGYELFSKKRPQDFELFEQPGGRAPEAENIENLPPGYYERLVHGKDSEWVAEYVDGQYPSADRGSVYGRLIADLEARGAISDFPHPLDGVYAVFDLGVSDATAIWWFRIGRDGVPDIIDWYEATGRGASHFFEVLDGRVPEGVDRPRAYQLQRIYLPHDARQRTFQTGVSTLDQFLRQYPGRVGLVPELDVASGIDGARWLLEQPIRIQSRCADGVTRLRSYRYEWDEAKKVFKKTPLHDWTSHTADSFRYLAAVTRPIVLATTKPPEPSREIKPALPTFDQALEEHIRRKRRGQYL